MIDRTSLLFQLSNSSICLKTRHCANIIDTSHPSRACLGFHYAAWALHLSPSTDGHVHADIIQPTLSSYQNQDDTIALACAASTWSTESGAPLSPIHLLTLVPFRHWQLRSQIGLSSRHVYYVAGTGNTQVHKLDTTAHESEVVKLLLFAPRCLVARNGWICCGGENGEFVAFQANENVESSHRIRSDAATIDPSLSYIRNYVENGGPRSEMLDAFRDHMHGLSAEDRSQLALDTASDDTADSMPALIPADPRADANSNKNLVIRSKTFGKDRVNCITLWFPPNSKDGKHNGAYAQPVAVLANNDKHVTIVGLEDQEAVDELCCPDLVNRALISPDGRLLVAICDDPYLYVHERVPKELSDQGLFTRKDLMEYEWKLCAKVHLKSQRKDDRSDQRGSFAACFSSAGRYLAVGTQYGVISIFETAAFLEHGVDPLITTFASSRPKEDVGAIRDMAFCPGPFDLLAWTEHRGRVGVADIRSNYVSRQILDLDNYDDYDQIMITERGSIDPRLLERNDRGELALVDSGEGGNRRSTRRAAATDYNAPFAGEDTMILDAHSEQRRRRDQVANRNNAAGARLIERLQNRAASRDAATYREIRNTNNRVSDIVDAQRDRIREQSERLRARRLANTESNPSRDIAFPSNTERAANVVAALRALRNQVAPSPHIGDPPRPSNPDNNTTDLENLYQSTFDVLGSGSNYEPGQGEPSTERNRDYLASVWSTILRHRDADAETVTGRIQRARVAERMELNMNRINHEHDDTAGLAWSEDGRVL